MLQNDASLLVIDDFIPNKGFLSCSSSHRKILSYTLLFVNILEHGKHTECIKGVCTPFISVNTCFYPLISSILIKNVIILLNIIPNVIPQEGSRQGRMYAGLILPLWVERFFYRLFSSNYYYLSVMIDDGGVYLYHT